LGGASSCICHTVTSFFNGSFTRAAHHACKHCTQHAVTALRATQPTSHVHSHPHARPRPPTDACLSPLHALFDHCRHIACVSDDAADALNPLWQPKWEGADPSAVRACQCDVTHAAMPPLVHLRTSLTACHSLGHICTHMPPYHHWSAPYFTYRRRRCAATPLATHASLDLSCDDTSVALHNTP
jgi:hypothetical protein